MSDAEEQSMSAGQNIETARQMYQAFGRGDVPRRHVEGVTGLVGLLAVGVADGDLPGQQVPPVRALAAVSGQPAQQRASEWLCRWS